MTNRLVDLICTRPAPLPGKLRRISRQLRRYRLYRYPGWSSHFLRQVTVFVREHLTEDLSVEEKAQEYLRMTDRSLMEISTYLGFSSQGYFQNVFKKMTGLTPKEYRERQRLGPALNPLPSALPLP